MNRFYPYRNNCRCVFAACALLTLAFLIPTLNICGLESENLDIVFEKASHDSLYFFGNSIACAGDMNGDGYYDVIIAADSAGPCPGSPDSSYVGKANLFYGGSPMDTIPDLRFTQGFKGDFSIDVSSAGDINADGLDDVLMGVQSADGWGKVYIFFFFGGLEPDTVPDMVLSGEELGAFPFGCSVSYLGDVNRDGFDDFAVGAYSGEGGQVYIYFGGPGLDTIPDEVLRALQPAENFGVQVGGGSTLLPVKS